LQHLVSGDTNLVEDQPSVVLAMISELGANVTAFDAWHPLVVLKRSDLDNEGSNTVIVVVNEKSCHYEGVRAVPAHVSWPELGGSNRWRVNHELVSFGVKSSCGLQLSHVRSVSQLRLCVASEDI
jgi:hypothetical protein